MAKLFKYYVRYLPLILLTIALLIVQVWFDLELPSKMAEIVEKGIFKNDMDTITRVGLVMLGYSLAVTACSVAVSYLAAVIGSKASKAMRADIFQKVSNFSEAEIDKFTISSLITRSTNDVTQIQMFMIMLIRMAFSSPIMAIGGIIKAIEKSKGMTDLVWVIVIAVAVIVVVIGLILLIVQPKFKQMQKQIDQLNLVAREGLNGMMVIRAFNAQAHEEGKFDSVNKGLERVMLFVNRIMVLLMPVIMVVMNGVSIAVIWIASLSAGNVGEIANMMAFTQYATQIVMSFMMLIFVFIILPRASVSAKRIVEVLHADISVQNKPGAQPVETQDFRGVVQYEDVCFRYGNSEKNVLDHISFEARPGQVTAIIGGTGSGKSSLIKLLPRLYDASSGRITIDGIDVKDLRLHDLRELVSYVPQKNVLFSGTIASNIKYADKDAEDARMEKAAEIAQATEFIVEKAEGFQSEITHAGDNVSGGQKQRLAIARALLKHSPVYVFDDSFSALDFKTDANLRKALREDLSDVTIMIVAQRVGTILNADQILVLDGGVLVGTGTHGELMQSCEVYRDIAYSQLSEEELAV